MKPNKLFFILILSVSWPSFSIAGLKDTRPYLFVLDMDRLFIDQKTHLYDEVDPKETVTVGNEHYRIAPYAPEFLAALHFYLPLLLKAPVKIAIFSGGSHARNQEVVDRLRLSRQLLLSDIVSDIKSFEDLTLLKPLPPGIDRSQAVDFVRSQGGQDKFPFFEVFKKDLSLFSFDLDHVIIFEDNMNATPKTQLRNVLGVARPDIFEQRLNRNTLDGRVHWAPDGAVVPIQIARAHYRLVRAIGLLAAAVGTLQSSNSRSLPDILYEFQWSREEGKYRHNFLNNRVIYYWGMSILESVYQLHLKHSQPNLQRKKDYFHFDSVLPSVEDCDSLMKSRVGVLPWSES